MALGEKSFFAPFAVLANLFRKPLTIRYPAEDLEVHEKKGASMIYRGMHTNDHEVCIGCGTCSTVCPTAAINMKVPPRAEGEEAPEGAEGTNPERPVVDYGRCCFCAFCVDVCPTGSLSMSRNYIYTQPSIKEDPLEGLRWKQAAFTIQPDQTHAGEKSWQAEPALSWLDFTRRPMEMMEAAERIGSFVEFVKGFSAQAAMEEAQRCVECGLCTDTCPAHMNIPEYIRGIFDGDLPESVRQIYRTNPLPSVCGRICTHNCESVCALSHRGEAVAIRWLKRYAIDALPAEQVSEISKSLDPDSEEAKKAVIKPSGKRVAIVGAGPAGLAAAYYLAHMGHQITLFERMPKAGGTMRYGIPAYRLPDEAIDRDLEAIVAMGVEIRCNSKVDDPAAWTKLKDEHDALIIAVGFPGGRSTRIENHDHKDVQRAILLLNDIRLGKEVPLHEKIVVIGGGNVAMDIVRSLARLQKQRFGKVDMLLTSLECEEEMPADQEEIEESREEGVIIEPGWAPKRIRLDEAGKVDGLEVARCLQVFDEEGRFNPKIDEDDKAFYAGSQVIEAIGQAPGYGFLSEEDQEKLGITRGRFARNDTGATPESKIFVAGDIIHGPDVISAIRDGHNAARAIDELLTDPGPERGA